MKFLIQCRGKVSYHFWNLLIHLMCIANSVLGVSVPAFWVLEWQTIQKPCLRFRWILEMRTPLLIFMCHIVHLLSHLPNRHVLECGGKYKREMLIFFFNFQKNGNSKCLPTSMLGSIGYYSSWYFQQHWIRGPTDETRYLSSGKLSSDIVSHKCLIKAAR